MISQRSMITTLTITARQLQSVARLQANTSSFKTLQLQKVVAMQQQVVLRIFTQTPSTTLVVT